MVPTWASITSAISQVQADCAVKDIGLVVGLGSALLIDLTDDLVAGRPILHTTPSR